MKKSGAIEALNLSPKGFQEGFLLRTGKSGKAIAQINLPKDERDKWANRLSPGELVTVEVAGKTLAKKPRIRCSG